MRRKLLTVLSLFFAGFSAPLLAAATPEDARQLAEYAERFYNAYGEEIALQYFNHPEGGFVSQDLYVFVARSDGIVLAHGRNPNMSGTDLSDFKTADGQELISMLFEAAGSDEGTFSYAVQSHSPEGEVSQVMRHGYAILLDGGEKVLSVSVIVPDEEVAH